MCKDPEKGAHIVPARDRLGALLEQSRDTAPFQHLHKPLRMVRMVKVPFRSARFGFKYQTGTEVLQTCLPSPLGEPKTKGATDRS